MNTKIKRIINLIILIALAIGTFMVVKSIPSFLLKEASIEKVEISERLEMAPGAVFYVSTNIIDYGGYWRVLVDGIEQLYCAEKGGTLNGRGETYEAIVEYVNSYNGKSLDGKCAKPEEKVSYPYYKVTSTRKATPAEAFILTWPDPDWNSWSKVKQEAIWDTASLSNNKKPPKETVDGIKAEEIDKYAEYYATFHNSLNGGSMVKGDATDKENVKVSVAQEPDEYIVGPFKIDYINGVYGVTFGGITNMYIVGENGNIPIKSFIIGGEEITPSYFTVIDDKHLIGVGPQNYPAPNEEFYVKYDATSDEQINSLHVDFQWMEAEATITYYDAVKYKSVFTCKHKDHCHGHTYTYVDEYGNSHNVSANCGKCCFTCTVTGKVEEFNPQYQKLLSAEGKRIKKIDELEIPIPDIPPSPEDRNLTIKLAGNVWEDEDSGKESLPNGIKEEDNPDTKDINEAENWKAGVEVILHLAGNGSVVAKTVTDTNGYYEFNGLNAQEKYYIEFVYDGQIYQATQYDTSLTNEERLYDGKDVTQHITNATEIQSERLAYNNHFAEIGSAPGNYKVRRPLEFWKIDENPTNTAYIISKYGNSQYCKEEHDHKNENCSTPYGIKEIYDYVIEQATETKSYATAYANALFKFGDNDTVKSKLQFIEDCRISSYTGYDTSRVNYPIWDNFTESTVTRVINGVTYYGLYPKHLNIDFGLNLRETFDLSLRKDVEKATIEINGKTHTYTYDTRNGSDETNDGTWDISVRLSDAYYNTKYSREIFGSDYQYKASDYGDETAQTAYGKSKEDELNVYVTYKLTVRNRSQSVLGEVMEIVDYYDEDYEYVDERSYIEIKYGIKETNDANTVKMAKEENLAMVGKYPVNAVTVTGSSETESRTKGSKYGVQGNINETVKNETTIDGYDKLYITGLQDKKLSTGQTAYIYLTFKVKKDQDNTKYKNEWIRLDETVETATAIGVGKENIAEINGFKTYYRDGTYIPNVGTAKGYSKAAGLFDQDSVPGNINPDDVPKDGDIKYENFENDTDKAPNIRLILYREIGENGELELVCRTIDGIVWEDERTEDSEEQKTSVADGVKQDEEIAINGVTVQLVELMNNGTEYIWKQFSSGQNKFDQNAVYEPIITTIGNPTSNDTISIPSVTDTTEGKYIFKSYMPGNYVVRFIYGDTVKTVLPKDLPYITNAYEDNKGQNAKSYNGQDYKSTTYQEGKIQTYTDEQGNVVQQSTIEDIYTNNTSGSYTYNITASEAVKNISDAKDIMIDDNNNVDYYRPSETLNSRQDVIEYSDENVTNDIAEVLASHEKLPLKSNELTSKLTELMKETQMTAETGRMNIEVEYDRNSTDNQIENNDTTYKIKDVSLGLEERPKAQLSINKEVTNVKLTLADGSTLFDATQKATNVLWRDHKPYEFDYKDEQYENKLVQDPMTIIREENTYDAKFGLIQISMDEELMHGATIKVSYKITVTNVGEVDYKDDQFYYTGKITDRDGKTAEKIRDDTVVKTQANQLIDYVANNLQFYAIDNNSWKVISQTDLLNGPVNVGLANETAKYNTVITTNENSKIANTALTPKIYNDNNTNYKRTPYSVDDTLILTQLITSENETDDLTYRNIVEIVKTSNDVGRRNAYSVVGNQNPTVEPTEVDTDRAEIIKILPPFGNGGIYYIIAAVTVLASAILIIGIIFIKKKVLR